MVSARLLGGASLHTDNGVVAGPPAQRHRLALVALLALSHSRPLSRDKLVALLWPNRDGEHARGLLKQSVHALRRAFGERAIVSSGDALSLDPEAVSSDVRAFEVALAAGALAEAVSLYSGPLLVGFHLPDAPEFERWLDSERDRLRRAFIEALQRLAEAAAARGDMTAAAERWRQVAAEDPCSGRVTVRLMEVLDTLGDRAGALEQARAHTIFLRNEFEAEPDPQVTALAERLRGDALGTPHRDARHVATRAASPADLGAHREASAVATPARYPLVGRDEEWARLRAVWSQGPAPASHFVLVVGEAGIGKTRLAEELIEWAGRQAIATARTRCYAAEGQLPYAPVADWLRSPALKPGLGILEPTWLFEVSRLLPELRLPHADPDVPDAMASWQRQRLFAALARAVLVRGKPTVLLVDDLQWCDQDTLQWLHYLLRFETAARLVVIGTARDDELAATHPLRTLVHELRGQQKATVIELRALSPASTASLGAKVAGSTLTPEQGAALYRQTEGHPLFVVETIRGRLLDPTASLTPNESPGAAGPSLLADIASLPPPVQAVIQARLSRLSPSASVVAGVAAVMGRDFSIDELSRACDSDEDVVESLDELCHRRIIREHGAGRFDFTHDRLREVAYWSVGPARRHVLHRRSADALAGAHASNLDPVSAQIAAHYEQGGVPEQAVAFYERAAGVATRIFANEETIGLIERALRILASLPDGIERQRRELALRIALCAPLRASRGWAHPELAENIARARTLADRVGIESERLTVLWQQVSIQFVAATDVRPALATAEEALRLAVESADPALLSPAHHWVGNQLCQRGEFARAREYLDRAVALYDRRYHARHLALFGADYGVLARVFNVHALWHLGYPDQAVGVSRDALALAEELLHPFSRAIALAYDATLHQFRRDVEATQRQTAALVALSTEYGFTYYTAWGKILHGWVLAQQGKARRSIPELRSGIEALDATGTELRRSYYLSLLAEAYGAQGEVHAGLRLIEEALLISERSGECWKDAELHRLRGCLLLAQGASAQEAEATFRHAIAVAQQQEARMLELRVSVSFGRLLQQLGRHTQAREMIAPILEWFTEGFDARDLVEARALLAELR